MTGSKVSPNLLNLLDRPIAFHRVFADITGSIPAALFLSQALYWHKVVKGSRNGWWWKTSSEWFHETRLTRAEQSRARKKLVEMKILDEDKRGIPCRLWYRINEEVLLQAIQSAVMRKTRSSNNQVCRDSDGKFVSPQGAGMPTHRNAITETTAKNTTKTKTKPAFGGNKLKKPKIEDLEYYQNMFQVEFPEPVLQLNNVDRVAAILLKSNLEPEQVRHVFAEFTTSIQKGEVRDPWALFVTFVSKSKNCDLNLSNAAEQNLPPWS
ncbi:MAG: hypothetical protein Q9N62_07610 [Ghiorsea sp.]|nr:hypothetical protein [Ghiorsea sp.]